MGLFLFPKVKTMPQGVIATIPKFQFSANGIPMVGGTLTVYIAGTTTPTNTWQDSALTVANTNPITLDSRGECVLWLDSAVTYKLVLKNAQGVVQWTQDDIRTTANISNALRTDLASSTGAALIGRGASTVDADLSALEATGARLSALAPRSRYSRPAFIEQHITGFFGRGMLTDEAINITTEQLLTTNAAAGASSLSVTTPANFVIGGSVTVKHDNGLYGTYFVDAISGSNIGIRPALRYACVTAAARIERTWYNRAHPGKFYMRELAQRIARSTELDAAMPNGARVLYTSMASASAPEDVMVALAGAAVGYYDASNLGESASVASPIRFGPGRTAYVDAIAAAGAGMETPFFDVRDVASALVKVVYHSKGVGSTMALQIVDETGTVRSKYLLPSSVNASVQQIYTYPADLRGARRVKVQIIADSYAAPSGYFTVGQIDVFEAPESSGKIIANPGAKIVVLGDSWAAGDLGSTPNREPITTQLALELPYATIINKGVGGNKVTDMLARFDADVTPNAPDYVVVDTGTNESYNPLSEVFDPNARAVFVDVYRQLLNKINSINARAIIIGVPALAQSDADVPAFTEWQLNDRAKAYARSVFDGQGGKPSVMSGSNANGSWTKFLDGTLICRHTVSVTTTAVNTPASTAWTYPVPFTAAPKVTVSLSNYSTGQAVGTGTSGGTATTASVVMVTPVGALTLTVDCVAVGRWYA